MRIKKLTQTSSRLARALVAGILLSAASAHAAIDFNFNGILVDTQFVAGTGSNSAMIVVSYPDSTGQAFAFNYQWDGAATLNMAFDAIQTASAGDFVWDGQAFVLQMDYFDPDTTTQYDSSNSGWMAYWSTANSDATGWSSNAVGIFDQNVLDGSWQWVNADTELTAGPENNWSGPTPDAYGTVIVPEPSRFALAGGFAAAIFLMVRRKRTHA